MGGVPVSKAPRGCHSQVTRARGAQWQCMKKKKSPKWWETQEGLEGAAPESKLEEELRQGSMQVSAQ
jgi:hypothetical protein